MSQLASAPFVATRPAEGGQSLYLSSLFDPKARPPGILIVDDHEGVRKVVGAGMKLHGFTVWMAADGRSALDLYRRHYESVDVVLLDVLMPEFDGPDTLQALHEINPHICCSFMSGGLGAYTEQYLYALGARAFFPKPLKLAEVARRLRELVGVSAADSSRGNI